MQACIDALLIVCKLVYIHIHLYILYMHADEELQQTQTEMEIDSPYGNVDVGQLLFYCDLHVYTLL